MTPAAPLEKAVEKLRDDLKYVNASRVEADHGSDVADVIRSAEALLAALDADPWWSVWQKTYEHQRKAEEALEEIRNSPTAMGKDIARRYFAWREGEKGETNG